MTWNEHDGIDIKDIPATVLVISDSLFSGSRDMSEDESGSLALELLSNLGFSTINLDYFPDEITTIRSKIQDDISDKVGLILLIGGTGIAKRDVTIDAINELIKRQLPGFGEEFRRRSYEEIQGKALLTRVTAGTKEESLIVGLPGSPNAVQLGIEIISQFIYHAMELLRE